MMDLSCYKNQYIIKISIKYINSKFQLEIKCTKNKPPKGIVQMLTITERTI